MSKPESTGGKQLQRAVAHEPVARTPAAGPSAAAPSNAAVAEAVEGEAPGGGFLDGLGDLASAGVEKLGDWWSTDDTSGVGPFAMQAPNVVEEVFGKAASVFDGPSVMQGPTSHDPEQGRPTKKAGGTSMSVLNGALGPQSTYHCGPLVYGGFADLTQGQVSGKLGFEASGVEMMLSGGVDLSDDRNPFEGVSLGYTGKVDDVGVQAELGARDTVADVVEDEGVYKVSAVRGWAGKAGAGADVEDGNGLGFQHDESEAETVERTFQSREEAEAWREAFSWDQGQNEASALGLKTGETLSMGTIAKKGAGANGVALAPMGGGVKQDAKVDRTYTMEENQLLRVKSTDQRTDGAEGSLGASVFGLGGGKALRQERGEELTFDLSQPHVAGLLLAYQASGELPEKLPPGVDRVYREHLMGPVTTSTATAGFVDVRTEQSVLTGTREANGEKGRVARGTREETAGYRIPLLGTSFSQGMETHGIDVVEMPGQPVEMSSHSKYTGRDAVASAVDDTSRYQDLYDAHATYGHEKGDIVVDSDFAPGAATELHERAAAGKLENNEIDGALGFEDLKRGLAGGFSGAAIARYIGMQGGDGLAALRDNTAEHRRDYVQIEGSELMGTSTEVERANQAEIDEVIASGDVERARVLHAQEEMYLEALSESAESYAPDLGDVRAELARQNVQALGGGT